VAVLAVLAAHRVVQQVPVLVPAQQLEQLLAV
jgi:hypothetical protein